jgi:hypothetical protein
MHLTFEIPDNIAGRSSATGDLSRRALAAFALEEYKAGRISIAELRRLLGCETRCELDGFLKNHEAWSKYSTEDLHRDIATLERLGF